MTPIYFPFTYLPDSTRTAVLGLFSKIIVYRPLSSEAPGKESKTSLKACVEEKLPLVKYNGRIEKIFKDYLNWAEHHETDQLRNLKSHIDAIPFFDESSSFRIKSEIASSPGEKEEKQIGADFRSGLFLMYAEYLDKRNAEINSGLQSIQRKTDEMLKELKGADFFLKNSDVIDDAPAPPSYMINERLNAWASLMIRDIPESGLFLTSNQEVISALFDEMGEADTLLDYSRIPLSEDPQSEMASWRKQLHEFISSIALEIDQNAGRPALPPPPLPGTGEDCLSFKLYRMAGTNPVDFFSSFSPDVNRNDERREKYSKYTNTLIGIIQF